MLVPLHGRCPGRLWCSSTCWRRRPLPIVKRAAGLLHGVQLLEQLVYLLCHRLVVIAQLWPQQYSSGQHTFVYRSTGLLFTADDRAPAILCLSVLMDRISTSALGYPCRLIERV